MAEIEGAWDMEIRTPMGPQTFVMTLVREDDGFRGDAVGELGSVEIKGGRIEGDEVRWPFALAKPFAMKLEVRATVTDDRIIGSVDAGFMGKMPINGTRRAAA